MLRIEVSTSQRRYYGSDVEDFERELRTATARLVARLVDKHKINLGRVQFTKPKRT